MFYEEIYTPRISDCDRNGRLSYSSLLCILEDLGSHHSAAVNDDVLQSSLSGVSWICTNWRISVKKQPSGVRRLKAATWALPKTSDLTVLREFTVCDEAGRELVLAEAKFAMLDLRTGRPVSITDELYDAYRPESRTVFDTGMQRLVPPKEYDSVTPVALRKTDIDFNGHVHNTRYLDIAMEGAGDVDTADITAISIAYRKPVKETDRVTVSCRMQEGGRFLCVSNETNPCCFVELKERTPADGGIAE